MLSRDLPEWLLWGHPCSCLYLLTHCSVSKPKKTHWLPRVDLALSGRHKDGRLFCLGSQERNFYNTEPFENSTQTAKVKVKVKRNFITGPRQGFGCREGEGLESVIHLKSPALAVLKHRPPCIASQSLVSAASSLQGSGLLDLRCSKQRLPLAFHLSLTLEHSNCIQNHFL